MIDSEDFSGMTSIMEGLLREQASHHTTFITKTPSEKTQNSRQDSSETILLNMDEKKERLERMLKNRKNSAKRRGKVTKNVIRSDAAKILEQFLQSQLDKQDVQTSPHKYQRYVEVDVTETTPSGSSSGYLASKSSLLRENSIPYMDESDTEMRKAESLPHDDFPTVSIVYHAADGDHEVHHAKSKSAPYSGAAVGNYASMRLRKQSQPPPPPPPGTPHSASEHGSREDMYQRVPYTGDHGSKSSSQSRKSFEQLKKLSEDHGEELGCPSLDNEALPESAKPSSDHDSKQWKTDSSLDSSQRHSIDSLVDEPRTRGSKVDDKPSTIHVDSQYGLTNGALPKRPQPPKDMSLSTRRSKKSSTLTGHGRKPVWSSDSEGSESGYTEQESHGRKKKSMFKRAQVRLQTFFRTRKKRALSEDEDGVYEPSGNKSKEKKHYNKEDESDNVPDNKVTEKRHVQRNRHVHQTHGQTDGSTVLRTEDVQEAIDIIDHRDPSRNKHIDARVHVKESVQDGGFMGMWRRLTSKDKKRVSGSKSAHFDQADHGRGEYNRTVSVPASRPGDEDKSFLTVSGTGFVSGEVKKRHRPGTTEVGATQVVGRDDIKRRSSHIDIFDHDGQLIERHYFDHNEDHDNFPRNKSFEFDEKLTITEKHVKGRDGERVVRDVDSHSHMETMLVTDRPTGKKEETMHDDQIEKIASRLAEIGDVYHSRYELDQAARSPRRETRDKMSPEKEEVLDPMQSSSLSTLEQELVAELHRVAGNIDANLNSNARQAAMKITKMVTYNHFEKALQESVSSKEGWSQIATVFRFTKSAIKAVGATGALAVQIKENSLRFIEDTFADWIVGQGGWESMLSEDSDDSAPRD
ncbi:uncharacterized protein LOC127850817 [Dreissena polymorpha]|uniref:Uncharacterized protein n=1 Tax=Dreissena polymorpha TaxID=45954 RepID=A0A9D4D0Y5_DREPO|nr:uncharacterized protein LOC127850817 [Dreissena polymorpha]KAH3736122.1 hypothetical protein DPMN_042684 [Dreissena polymorpha]